jgi:hypothetical protein
MYIASYKKRNESCACSIFGKNVIVEFLQGIIQKKILRLYEKESWRFGEWWWN